MKTSLSYPIGKFETLKPINKDQIAQWIEEIATLPQRMKEAVAGLSTEQLDTPYRPEGWTIRQVIHHVPDSHMNSYIRFCWTLTEDQPTIKAYNEQAWATLPFQSTLPISASLDLLEQIHMRWVHLLKSLNQSDLDKAYIHPDDGKTNKLAKVIGMYAWHGNHHLAHITSLKARMNW
ncbi:DinB family protein [Roseivirga pacifica]|uniref:DinB superfamily protein n=1 Tax=Roseivirga pacifica TaxID=1267423 RepID=A0A1I0RJ06_9BACT|nr:putative metal-dependent hydrolase [Roseivirga pacifica]RKQ49705.1 DinB family protein [Roseivirga pacifica]SEW40855.1 DinB superfamily protein [Roseivirga pacifica]